MYENIATLKSYCNDLKVIFEFIVLQYARKYGNNSKVIFVFC